ncbi:MAG: CDP-diacylglycerol--glycerol-3-phosphate 3-phosphatidyltransferase [Verrucomicrobiae bacterium]|nr:CDP-diacylglycerol--glycerol-3-phosphate 3-phosphatidyltransferase [Verrucomicrobiae bacterium]
MNIPNQITIARLILTLLFVVAISYESSFQAIITFSIFVIASLTDWLDGYLARKWNQTTDLGKLLDPLADKILVTSALFFLVYVDMVPVWMAILMVSREFLITGLRLIATAKGVVLAAERTGKHKTISQIVAILLALAYLAVEEIQFQLGDKTFLPEKIVSNLDFLITLSFWIATLLTIASGFLYFQKNRHFLTENFITSTSKKTFHS